MGNHMSDIRTVWDVASGAGDYQVQDGALLAGKDVETAMLISLFTDRLADADDTLPDATQNSSDRRGWWGDTGEAYNIGSRLWLLDRSKAPMNLVNEAKGYAAEALQWMLDDLVVARFDINAVYVRPNQLRLTVIAYREDGSTASIVTRELW